MRWPWPFARRRRRLELLDADAKVEQAAQDRELAEGERDDAKELAEWARDTNLANRFDLRLEAAWRARLSKPDP
jgi:hypothetical protein